MNYSLDNISIRNTTEEDLDFVITAENAPENSPNVAQWTREQHINAFGNDDILHVVIEADARPVGYAIAAGLTDINKSIELRRIVIVDKGKGYGRSAIKIFKRLAFEDLMAHRLWLDVREYNIRAKKLYEEEGFATEGLLRECVLIGDKFVSIYMMSILRQEYINDRG